MKNRKGFTIVELVIVIAVIAILAAVLIPTFSGVVGKANESAREQSFTNALKVVIAGNAETGGLAAGTVFISSEGYYAVYNGNKLTGIYLIDDEIVEASKGKDFALTMPTDAATSAAYTIAGTTFQVNEANVAIKSVILPIENETYDTKAINFLAKTLGGGSEASYAVSNDKLTFNNLTLTVFPNVDLPSGFIVLSPSTSK